MKRRFFFSKFFTFLGLTLIPICILGFLSVFYTNYQLKQEAIKKTASTTRLMKQYVNELSNTLSFFRVSLLSDARFHLALIHAMNSDSLDPSTKNTLASSMQGARYAQNFRPYVYSFYLTVSGSPWFMNGTERESFEMSSDPAWLTYTAQNTVSSSFCVREIRRSSLDSATMPVITFYSPLKYQEILAVNLRQEVLNEMLDSITAYAGQALFVTDENGVLLFFNQNANSLSGSLFDQAGNSLPDPAAISDCSATGRYLTASGSLSSTYGLRYLSLIPRDEVFFLSDSILKVTFAAIIFSVLLSSVLAYFLTLRDYRQIFEIIDLFDQAEKGNFTPRENLSTPNAPYFQIINNIINLFISQSYLKVQLNAKKYALSTARLAALQYQLNPHFLFNTLQSIDLEILKLTHKPVIANHMIAALSELLRYSLASPTQPVSLHEEIAATQNYVRLQAWRLGEQFRFSWRVPDDLLDTKLQRLILQPIIENSISHSSLPDRNRLNVRVHIFLKNSHLTIRVLDNGGGISPDKITALQKQLSDNQVDDNGKHIGLKNISQRIRLGNPDGYVRIWSKYGCGTIVEIGGICPQAANP